MEREAGGLGRDEGWGGMAEVRRGVRRGDGKIQDWRGRRYRRLRFSHGVDSPGGAEFAIEGPDSGHFLPRSERGGDADAGVL